VTTALSPRLVRGPAIAALVVDDDEDFRQICRIRLEREGFRVQTAGSGEAALALLAGGSRIDLILLDYGLPGQDGLATLRQLDDRSRPAVVLATGMGSESVAVDALRAGAVDYLAKDAGFLDQLPGVMRRAWARHDLEQRARELQRLAIMLTSSGNRSAMLSDIVHGAHRLLRALGCAIYMRDADGVTLESRAGELPEDLEALQWAARRLMEEPHDDGSVSPAAGLALVPLRIPDSPVLGVLAVVLPAEDELTAGEIELAEAFAAFAGIAIANLSRLDIEREMVARLQDLVDARRQFVTSVSHELRTPLTCIQGFTSTLLAHSDQLTDQDRRESLEAVLAHTRDLNDLVEHLLQAAEVESARPAVRRTRTNLAAAVDSAIVLLGPLLRHRDIFCELDRVEALADPVLLHRVLGNLLSNAARYSPAEARISVRVRAIEGEARLEVSDGGIGIRPEELDRVFEPFWRASGPLRDVVRGTGIGLALVHEYVQAMDGRIEVTSEVDQGSTFTVTLPLAT
jgi:signal transduction histidine kinase/FixJ family two-component response regulator